MSLVTLAYGLMLSPKAHFFAANLTRGKEILDLIRENTPALIYINEATLGGECIEQPMSVFTAKPDQGYP